MLSRKLYILATLLSLCGLITPNGQVTSLDPHARLLQVAEDIDENVEDLEDGIDDIGDEIEDLEDEIEDVGEGIEDIETGVEAVAAKMVSLQQEVKTMRSEQQQLGQKVNKMLQNTENQHRIGQELAMMQGDINSTLFAVQELKQQLNALREDLILTPRSCSELDPSSPSGYYLVNWNRATVYCDMERQSCGCGSTPGWMRVADIDMTDPNQQCPPGIFKLKFDAGKRMCEMTKESAGCTSMVFPTHSVQYSRVCGRIKAYQYGSPDAFSPYHSDRSRTIDSLYVDGVSITHGWNPRKHIWTFSAAVQERRSDHDTCPCTDTLASYTGVVPPYIGNDYFCETGSRQRWQAILYSEDPLWDGQGCGPTSSCCQLNSAPWFCKKLPQPTTDDIELRMCRDEARSNEDTPFEVIELYVQ